MKISENPHFSKLLKDSSKFNEFFPTLYTSFHRKYFSYWDFKLNFNEGVHWALLNVDIKFLLNQYQPERYVAR